MRHLPGMPQREKISRLLAQLERAVSSVAGFALMREELLAIQNASDSEYTIEGVEEMLRTSDQFAITAQKLLDSLKVDLQRVQSGNAS
jgi:hypothetical protein